MPFSTISRQLEEIGTQKSAEVYEVLKTAGVTADTDELMKITGIGSVLYAKCPSDGSAREYAAGCQKVLGGLADICIKYATKRYRSNCVNWGILSLKETVSFRLFALSQTLFSVTIKHENNQTGRKP